MMTKTVADAIEFIDHRYPLFIKFTDKQQFQKYYGFEISERIRGMPIKKISFSNTNNVFLIVRGNSK